MGESSSRQTDCVVIQPEDKHRTKRKRSFMLCGDEDKKEKRKCIFQGEAGVSHVYRTSQFPDNMDALINNWRGWGGRGRGSFPLSVCFKSKRKVKANTPPQTARVWLPLLSDVLRRSVCLRGRRRGGGCVHVGTEVGHLYRINTALGTHNRRARGSNLVTQQRHSLNRIYYFRFAARLPADWAYS